MSKLDKLLNFIGGLPNDVKVHVSRGPISKLQKMPQGEGPKPNGLWYDCDKKWIDWVQSEMPEWAKHYSYIYVVHLNKSNILELKTEDDVLNFTEKYTFNKSPSINVNDLREQLGISRSEGYDKNWDLMGGYAGMGMHIDWGKVASQYSGIEICPYQGGLRMDNRTRWYYTWDIASGCVWDPAGVQIQFVGFWDDKNEQIVSKDEIIGLEMETETETEASSLSWYKKAKICSYVQNSLTLKKTFSV
jgi:hypothetical protein